MEKIIIESRLYPGWLIGSSTSSKVFYPELIVKDREITLDTSRTAVADMSSLTYQYPTIWIYTTLAYELGWFVNNPNNKTRNLLSSLDPVSASKQTVMKFLEPGTLNLILQLTVRHKTSHIHTNIRLFPDGPTEV